VRLRNSLNISSVLVAFYTFVCLPLDTLHDIFLLLLKLLELCDKATWIQKHMPAIPAIWVSFSIHTITQRNWNWILILYIKCNIVGTQPTLALKLFTGNV